MLYYLLVYIILPDKKEITYHHMFLILNILKPNLNTIMIKVNFEKDNMNAASFEHPNSKIQGCFFISVNMVPNSKYGFK